MKKLPTAKGRHVHMTPVTLCPPTFYRSRSSPGFEMEHSPRLTRGRADVQAGEQGKPGRPGFEFPVHQPVRGEHRYPRQPPGGSTRTPVGSQPGKRLLVSARFRALVYGDALQTAADFSVSRRRLPKGTAGVEYLSEMRESVQT